MERFLNILLAVLGWICVVFALLGLMVSLSKGMDGIDVAMVLFFSIVGAGLIYASRKRNKTGIEQVAPEMEMFNQVSNFNVTNDYGNVQTADMTQVKCDSCGANIHINAGSGGKCEYCGSHITKL